jgi:hypothetical protein
MKRATTIDRAPPEAPAAAGMQIHATEQISTNMKKLPNGNLLCMNVPVARTGWLLYGPGEVPVKPGPNGIAYVERTTDALFVDSILNSLNAAAVTNNHPPVDVTPENWKQYAGGFALNARRGTGDDADVVLVDLMLTDRSLIADVLSGKREVSWGYDADYRDDGAGVGRQFNMSTNHIALVDKGRCGPRCAIGDQEYQPPPKETKMKRVKIRGSRRTIDAAGLAALQATADAANAALLAASGPGDDDEEDEGDDKSIHIHVGEPAKTVDKAIEDRFTVLETGLGGITATLAALTESIAALVPAKTNDGEPKPAEKPALTLDSADEDLAEKEGDDDKTKAEKETLRSAKETRGKTADSAALQTSYTELLSQAEILVPGFKAPTFDAAMNRASTVDRMCNVRSKVLDQFSIDPAGADLLKGLNGGQPVDTVSMDCAAKAILFKAAAGAKALLNNAAATRDSKTVPTPLPVAGIKAPLTIAEINERNAKYWEATLVK